MWIAISIATLGVILLCVGCLVIRCFSEWKLVTNEELLQEQLIRSRQQPSSPTLVSNVGLVVHLSSSDPNESQGLTGEVSILNIGLVSWLLSYFTWFRALVPHDQPILDQHEDTQTRHQPTNPAFAFDIEQVNQSIPDSYELQGLTCKASTFTTEPGDQPPSYNTLFPKSLLEGKTKKDSLPSFEEATKMKVNRFGWTTQLYTWFRALVPHDQPISEQREDTLIRHQALSSAFASDIEG